MNPVLAFSERLERCPTTRNTSALQSFTATKVTLPCQKAERRNAPLAGAIFIGYI
jgi:hypothetical protein